MRAFARAIGADGSEVPPTFATAPEIEALAQVLEDPELDLDFTRVVHTEESYEWVRPIRIGEELTARPAIESIRSKAGSEILVVATEIRDQRDAAVVHARCTLVARPPAREKGEA
ncbi:MAG: MaoC family dehydratase N-terminal domain-containing protein [Actinomycetota bacterium]|nr:MaoC family dehydratase N-terminal domain-containing protein [Actinomycetota bacterium]